MGRLASWAVGTGLYKKAKHYLVRALASCISLWVLLPQLCPQFLNALLKVKRQNDSKFCCRSSCLIPMICDLGKPLCCEIGCVLCAPFGQQKSGGFVRRHLGNRIIWESRLADNRLVLCKNEAEDTCLLALHLLIWVLEYHPTPTWLIRRSDK